jgi:hypothetical protein
LVHTPFRQAPASVSDEAFAGQVADEQGVLSGYFWQPPLPSHIPFVPQLEAPWSPQKPDGAAVPAMTAEHAPLPERLQAVQGAQLGEPQQTPSTQLPLMH